MHPLWITIIAVVTAACGQMTMKLAMTGGAETDVLSPLTTMLNILGRPLVYVGLAFYAVSAFLWLTALQKLPLSYMYPFTALTILIISVSSSFLFNEPFSAWNTWRVGGLAFIVIGLVLMAKS